MKSPSPRLNDAEPNDGAKGASGAQTLVRGLTLLELVAQGIGDVKGLSERLGVPRSTLHRVLSNLVAEGYLHHVPYQGYTLGYKLIYLGTRAREQRPLTQIARPFLEALVTACGATVHLGQMEGSHVLYLDKLSGDKGLEMRSRIGQRMPLISTGVGKALMLGLSEARWRELYDEAQALKERTGAEKPSLLPWPDYLDSMRAYRRQGWVMECEENELGIHCVGAPVRDVNGEVVAAVSIASVNFYMPRERMLDLGPVVAEVAGKISHALGAADQGNP
ncbi:IclR family transcriptional regulator [Azospirillum rugosum]|uniref:DNA-binding IclR family transcriptional regulator n=1 Tax=Azospirillum rugosum TaxID=416170 RepID=A0ABS4SMB5_9PROT|nr:IclR family transcriptional regulator [Azospirillum rugosum]MBP2293701.1 DNA-binding IclR family transcriptional regulator [Azospirillum rugosum]MDQ0527246.1 DNA-binding IclR family transcriptional regulator [Azospirillum rugosum]